MESIENAMKRILEEIDIEFEEQIVSKELIIQTFGDFLRQTFEKEEHNVGLVMHTGSVCFDIIAVTYAALFCILSTDSAVDSVVDSFQKGDMVIYGSEINHKVNKQRYVFDGIANGEEIKAIKGMKYIKLSQGEGKTTYVPQYAWKDIEPYNGEATTLDGRGLKAHNSIRDDFFIDVLKYEKSKVPSIIDVSAVIIATKERIDYLIKGISLLFSGKRITLLELVTASYFTEEEEFRYGGNIGKNEPVLKFASRVSSARSLILARGGNKHIGVMVIGDEIISRGYSELPELINRKSLQFVYVCSSMDNGDVITLFKDIDAAEVFACTKDFLLEHSRPENIENNSLVSELSAHVSNIIEKDNIKEIIREYGISKTEYRDFKKCILSIKQAEYTSEDKDNFLVEAWSLMKLFDTSIFPIRELEENYKNHTVEVEAPSKKIENLVKLADDFPERIKEQAGRLIELLKELVERLDITTGKYQFIRMRLNSRQNEKIAIVVPKAYYATVLRNMHSLPTFFLQNKDIVTPNRFDKTKNYDTIYVVGNVEGKNFNAFRCTSSKSVISLLYECDVDVYNCREKSISGSITFLQSRSTIEIEDSSSNEIITEEEAAAERVEVEMEDFTSQISYAFIPTFNQGGDSIGMVNCEIVSIGFFDDDTMAYFSKRYKGYVLDESTGVAKEVESLNICEGDLIVFTSNNNETKDVVSAILGKMIAENKLTPEIEVAYSKAKLWKTALSDYMHRHGVAERYLVSAIIKCGAPVEEATILRWLDDDSHTVGPQSVESIRAIGRLTGEAKLIGEAEEIYAACRVVRAIRRKILNQVGLAIVDRISGKKGVTHPELADIYDKIDSLATIKRVEKIKHVSNMTVPMNVANKPISN